MRFGMTLLFFTRIDGFVCCDKRLLAAAEKEQLSTINPYAEDEKQQNKSLE